MSLADLNAKLKLNGPTPRPLADPVSGNLYYVLGQNPYYEESMKKRVKCGLGHQMWVTDTNFICCDNRKCQAKIKLTPIK
jgi:hypothetical protein